MPTAHLFIDTNVFLNFYHFADDDLTELDKLIKEISSGGICLHIPEQVRNELARNRESKLKSATDEFSKHPLPAGVPRHMQTYTQYEDYIAAIEQAKKLRGQLISIALADASNQTLQTDVLLRQLFSQSEQYAEDNEVFALALQRAQRGNPPGKAGSVGDQYNWEMLLKRVPNGDLHIVSRDGDYSSLLNKTRPHPSLETEWVAKKGGGLHLYPELRSFLKRHQANKLQAGGKASGNDVKEPPLVYAVDTDAESHVAIDAVAEATPVPFDPAKEEAIQSLIDSSSFASTHAAIAHLAAFKRTLTDRDAERLIAAAVANKQIKWIATDSDVYAFFASLITDHADINADLFEEAVDVFGLRPDPEEPLDD